MKKLTAVLFAASMICLLGGCSNVTDLTVPEGRNEDLSGYEVSDVEDVVLQGYINSQHSGDKNILLDEFDDFTTIKINDCVITLNDTTVDEIVSTLNLDCKWDDNLNCFRLSSNGTVMMMCTVENSQDAGAKIKGLTVCNMLHDFNNLSIEFFTVTDETSPSEAIHALGKASSSASSNTTSNYKWTWNDEAMNRKASYQMMWYEGQLSQIDLTME